jgi:hypothetical protein
MAQIKPDLSGECPDELNVMNGGVETALTSKKYTFMQVAAGLPFLVFTDSQLMTSMINSYIGNSKKRDRGIEAMPCAIARTNTVL